MAGVLGIPPAPRSAPEARAMQFPEPVVTGEPRAVVDPAVDGARRPSGPDRDRTSWWPGGPLIPASRTAKDRERRTDDREGAPGSAFLSRPVSSGLR